MADYEVADISLAERGQKKKSTGRGSICPLCSSCITSSGGEIVAYGTSEEVMRNNHGYTSGFMKQYLQQLN